MKRITFMTMLLIMAVSMGMVSLSSAQQREKTERIIIQKKGDKTEKMVIEIDGDKVKVNGKEVKEGDSNIVIKEFGDRDIYLRMPEIEMKQFRNLHRNREPKDFPQFKMEGLKELELMNPEGWNHNQNIFIFRKGPKLGASIQDTEDGNGVTIEKVEAESLAAKNGLQKDDIITEINGQKINDVTDAKEALHKSPEKSNWTIKVLRSGKPVTVEIKIPRQLKKTDLEP